MRVSQVDLESLDYVWQQLQPYIEKGLQHGMGDCTTQENLYVQVYTGDSIMWVVHEEESIVAGMILSILDCPAKKTLFVEMLAGRKLEDWRDELEGLLRDYKDLIGADTIEASCRRGFLKKLPNWKTKAVRMEL